MAGTIEYVHWGSVGGTAPAGWTCWNCGSWVGMGMTHSCTWRYAVPSVLGWRHSLTDEEIERIARRVAELLK